MPKVQYYLMGKNEWRQTNEWPVPGTHEQRWYLDSDGKANSRVGDGTLSLEKPGKSAVDRFIYDPASPVPSLGGHTCCTGTDTEAGGYDQSDIEMRQDVLVYTSDSLEKGIEVTGALEVVLQVSSSVVDTDFTTKLVDVYPDGRAFNIQEGALRMRHREGLDRDVMMEPGTVYEATLDLQVTSNYFGPGHRIRLEVSSSSFPRFERNLNTGGDNHRDTKWVTAVNNAGRYGKWAYDICRDLDKLPDLLARHAEVPENVLPFRLVEPKPETRWVECVPVTSLKAAAGGFSDEQVVEDLFPAELGEHWAAFEWPSNFAEGMFVAQVQGRSKEPKISDGAWCLFGAPSGSPEGKIVLVAHSGITDPAYGGHYTVKRFRSEKVSAEEAGWAHSVIHLEPLNGEFQPIRLTPESEADVRIVGELLGVIE